MFITFEGIEGSGKSTVIRGVARYLEGLGREVLLTREPGGSQLGKKLRAILLDPANDDITDRAELFMYLADRAQHVEQVVRPALARQRMVLCDRFADSTMAYQGYGRGLDRPLLDGLNRAAVGGVWPDITFLLDLAPDVGLARARARNALSDEAAREGRFEAETLSFHTRIRNGFLDMAAAEPGRFRIIDADQAPEHVLDGVTTELGKVLEG